MTLPEPLQDTGLFIAVEGIDGAGKSTLTHLAGDRLAADGVSFFARKHVCATPEVVHDSMASLSNLLWHRGDCSDDNLLPAAFWLHLQSAWYAAYSSRLLDEVLPKRSAVVVDGWYYKFMAKLLLRGFSQETLDAAFQHARRPDIVILLDVAPANVWKRDRTFNQAELGLHQGYARLGEDSFMNYQGKIFSQMLEFAGTYGWDVLTLDPEADVEFNCRRLCERLLQFITGQKPIGHRIRPVQRCHRGRGAGALIPKP